MEALKELIARQVRGMRLCDVATGIVEGVSPLRIRVGSKLVLEAPSLTLCDGVLGRTLDLSHTHDDGGAAVPDLSRTEVAPALAVGDVALLLRAAGGKHYYVIARTGGEEQQ